MKNLFFSFFFIGMILQAAEYKVSNSTELKDAILIAKASDKIILSNGEWKDVNILFNSIGEDKNPITLCAETPGKVIFTGNSSMKISGKYLVIDGIVFRDGFIEKGAVIEFRDGPNRVSSNCRLTNCVIENFNHPDKTVDYKWVSLYGTHNRVDHCFFRNKTGQGCLLVVWLSEKPNYHLIDSDYFAYRPVLGNNGGEIIRIGTSDWSMYDSFTTVEYNYFEECNGETEIISNKSCNNIYRYNTFKNCQGTLTLRHGNKCVVEGNYFFCGKNTDSGGIRIIGEDHKIINNYIEDSYGTSYKSAITLMNGVPNSPLNRYFQVKRALIAHNTIVNAKVSINIGAGKDSELTLPPLDCTIANNIFYSSYSPIVSFVDQPINMNWQGNIFYGGNIGMNISSENFFQNPELIKSNDGLYRLSSQSFAIDRGVSLSIPILFDFDGQTRNVNPDIGADEYSTEQIKIKPVSSKDVGPQYLRITSTNEIDQSNLPNEFQLFQNYPNPFNPTTTIKYSIPNVINKQTNHDNVTLSSSKSEVHVTLKLYDILGREIATLINEKQNTGTHNYQFSIGNFQLSSGIYFYTLQAGELIKINKMALMK